MHGTITASSRLNVGTEFRIELEFQIADHKKEEKVIPQLGGLVLEGKRVLLVEDNEINIEVSSILLEKKGIIVEVAKNGKDAVTAFESQEAGYYQTVPIIAMTANALESDMREAIDIGMNAYLTKPVIPDKMYAILAEYVK